LPIANVASAQLQEEAVRAHFVSENERTFFAPIPKFSERLAAKAGEMKKQTGR